MWHPTWPRTKTLTSFKKRTQRCNPHRRQLRSLNRLLHNNRINSSQKLKFQPRWRKPQSKSRTKSIKWKIKLSNRSPSTKQSKRTFRLTFTNTKWLNKSSNRGTNFWPPRSINSECKLSRCRTKLPLNRSPPILARLSNKWSRTMNKSCNTTKLSKKSSAKTWSWNNPWRFSRHNYSKSPAKVLPKPRLKWPRESPRRETIKLNN